MQRKIYDSVFRFMAKGFMEVVMMSLVDQYNDSALSPIFRAKINIHRNFVHTFIKSVYLYSTTYHIQPVFL